MQKLEHLEKKIKNSPIGKKVIEVIKENIDEVMGLINHNRKVMSVWHRNHGPEFIASIIKNGFDPGAEVKKTILGVSLQNLTLRMADAIQDNGSRKLSLIVAEYVVPVLHIVKDCNSVNDVIEKITQTDAL